MIGRLKWLGAVVLALALAAAGQPASAAVADRGCGYQAVRKIAVSGSSRPDALTVRATGRRCGAVTIAVTLRSASGALLWTEKVYGGLIEAARFPDEPVPEVGRERIVSAVDNWVSVEDTATAPDWPDAGAALPGGEASAEMQYDTPLSHARYSAIRASHEKMICTPVGPESTHCLAIDPATHRLEVFFNRGQ